MIDVHIYACESRRDNAEKLAKQTGGVIHWDTVDLPTPYERYHVNCKSAWLAPMPKRLTHRIVLADDAGICDGFLDVAKKCAKAFPKAVWSFVSLGEMDDAPYQVMCSRFPMGVAMMMPVEYITDIFGAWQPKEPWGLNTDETITERYIRRNGLRLMTTNPNIAAHLPTGESLLQPGVMTQYTSKTFIQTPDIKRWDEIKEGYTH